MHNTTYSIACPNQEQRLLVTITPISIINPAPHFPRKSLKMLLAP